MQVNTRLRAEFEVTDLHLNNLLDARTSVVEKEQQGPVAQRSRSTQWEGLEQCVDLLPLEKPCPRWWRPLGWHGSHALSLCEQLRAAVGRVLEQATQGRQALIACRDAVPSLLFEVIEETHDAITGEIGRP
jgi:hypothetical protein